MQDLNQLSLALRSGAQGQANLAGLDEKYADARGLRDSQGAQINKYGTVSPLAIAADVINNSRGRKDIRGLDTQRTAARAAIADNANALPLYQAREKEKAATQAQSNYELDNTNRANAALKLATAKVDADKLAASNRATTARTLADVNATAAGLNASDVTELFNTADPTQVKQVTERQGQYFDINSGELVDPTGWQIKPKVTRGSGSKFSSPKGDDEFGNVVLNTLNKSTGLWDTPRFVDGTPWTYEAAQTRGQAHAGQLGAEEGAKKKSNLSEVRQAELVKGVKSRANSMSHMNQAINALENGAGSGDIESNLPTWMLPNGEATILLRNAKKQLGLEQISEHTFGSLSEAEGLWVQQSQIPDLDEDELLPYMRHRKQAMERVIMASDYERKALLAGEEVDTTLISEILSSGGFDISNEFGYK